MKHLFVFATMIAAMSFFMVAIFAAPFTAASDALRLKQEWGLTYVNVRSDSAAFRNVVLQAFRRDWDRWERNAQRIGLHFWDGALGMADASQFASWGIEAGLSCGEMRIPDEVCRRAREMLRPAS